MAADASDSANRQSTDPSSVARGCYITSTPTIGSTQIEDNEHDNFHSPKRDSTSRPHQLPIDSQPPESRWSKRAGLHVLHCGPPLPSLRSQSLSTPCSPPVTEVRT